MDPFRPVALNLGVVCVSVCVSVCVCEREREKERERGRERIACEGRSLGYCVDLFCRVVLKL